ncbi:hypothetical protein ACQZ5D_03805 [Agrobacterium sp. 22-211-1]|uniref:hypothetical protein n=1 Tax=Agrobacterium tomkonis TaxID=1183410 RepID=UPI001CD985C2|nr:hypothetical protein [Agrobacterium tomkonis RTP8]
MTDVRSPFANAMALAKRLVSIGINPFQSDAERYVVLLDGGGGEILDWGKPLRGTRFFEPNAIRKDRPMVADFVAFAKRYGLKDCVYWGVGLTGAKADPKNLDAALKSFNEKINVEFSELRKSGKFEVLLLAIHPRYDEFSGLFDLHAHFVARVPPEHREAVKLRLRIKFSKTDFPDRSIRNAGAVATYMLWGIFRNDIMVQWPDNALRAAWKLTQSRFHFVRTGGSFRQWRASTVPVKDKAGSLVDDARKRSNRAETADTRQQIINGDRLLSKIMIKIRGVRISALLFETMPPEQAPSVKAEVSPVREYSSATSIATQESPVYVEELITSQCLRGPTAIWNRFRVAMESVTASISACNKKIHGIGQRIIRRLLS